MPDLEEACKRLEDLVMLTHGEIVAAFPLVEAAVDRIDILNGRLTRLHSYDFNSAGCDRQIEQIRSLMDEAQKELQRVETPLRQFVDEYLKSDRQSPNESIESFDHKHFIHIAAQNWDAPCFVGMLSLSPAIQDAWKDYCAESDKAYKEREAAIQSNPATANNSASTEAVLARIKAKIRAKNRQTKAFKSALIDMHNARLDEPVADDLEEQSS